MCQHIFGRNGVATTVKLKNCEHTLYFLSSFLSNLQWPVPNEISLWRAIAILDLLTHTYFRYHVGFSEITITRYEN